MRKALFILGELDERDLIWLSTHGELRELEEGSTLIRAGEPVSDLYFVTAGDLAVVAPGGARVASLGVGDVVGEMSFVEKRPPAVGVIAETDCRLLAAPRAALLEEFETNAGFAARFYHALAVFLSDRLRSTTAAAAGGGEDLDEAVLDNLHLAGERLLRLIDQLEGRARG